MEKVTQNLADFVIGCRYDDIPENVIETAKLHILDTIGCIFGGSREPAAEIICRYAASACPNNTDATILPFGFKASPGYAAMANGVIGHALDYDDYEVPSMAHPSVTVLPAVLALGEKEAVPGKECLAAYVAGMEVISKVGDAINPNHYDKGWHSTGTLGPLGAAAAAAKLLKLDLAHTQIAIGVAASMASGLRGNFGTMVKPFHAGHAARNGVEAAVLASLGFSAGKNILEHKLGYCSLFTDREDYDLQKIADLGKPFSIVSPGIGKKPYPSCGATHSYLDGIFELIRKYDITANDVESVYCGISKRHTTMLIYPDPKTGLEGKFSLEFCLALALVDRVVKLESFTDSKVQEPEIRGLIKRIRKEVTPQSDSKGTYYQKATIEVTLNNGRVISTMVDRRKGSPANPLTFEEVKGKFFDCASWKTGKMRAEKIADAIMRLEAVDDLVELRDLIVA